MNKISLIVNTLNEEKNISDCIESAIQWIDEVIVCDMHSDDRTTEIARSLGARIIFHEKTGFVEPARFYAISHASHEWVLVLDADEKMTDKLGQKLKQIANENVVDVVTFASLYNYFGGPVFKGGFFNNNWNRFFRKQVYLDSYNDNELIVHQNFIALSKLSRERKTVLPLDYYILHDAYPTIEKYVNKTVDYYARVEAMQKYKNGEEFSVVRMLFELIKAFIMTYFVRRGFLDGTRGLILSVHYAVYRFNIWANLWFLERQKKS